MDFDRLDEIARSLMLYRKSHLERETGHVYYHGRRVMNGVIQLRRLVTDDDSHDDILRVAALFHDCGKALEPHARTGVALVREYLKDELTPDELEAVCAIIARHDDRNHPEYDIWTRLQQDADLIDHYGVMEVWLNVFYSATYDRPPAGSVEFYDKEFDKQAEHFRRLINFDAAMRIYDEKIAFLKLFAERLRVEGRGEYWTAPQPE